MWTVWTATEEPMLRVGLGYSPHVVDAWRSRSDSAMRTSERIRLHRRYAPARSRFKKSIEWKKCGREFVELCCCWCPLFQLFMQVITDAYTVVVIVSPLRGVRTGVISMSANFLCTLLVAIARSFSDGCAKR